jgi:hypothetical protein
MNEGPSPLASAARNVGLGLALWGGLQLVAFAFPRNPTATLAIQAALAEWGAGAIGVAWSDPLSPSPSWKAVGGRVAGAAAIGSAAAALTVAVALAMHAASLAGASPSAGPLAIGLLLAALTAVRDELVLRGVVLRAMGDLLGMPLVILLCGGVAAAARLGLDGAITLGVAAEAFRGVALASLWVHGRGAWMAFGANTTWTFLLGSALRGAALDIRFADEPDAGLPALLVLALAAAAGFGWTLRSQGSQGTRKHAV